MKHLQPVLLILSLVASACVGDEASVERTDTDDTIASAPDTALGMDEQPEQPDDDTEQPPPPLSACDFACAGVTGEAAKDCGAFAIGGAAACGIAGLVLCEAVCHSRSAPRSHCSDVHGGKGCMTTQYMWWCDNLVDGNKVRMQYELASPNPPGIVKSVWAPSHACETVRFPNANVTKRWRVCAENNGCSGWFSP